MPTATRLDGVLERVAFGAVLAFSVVLPISVALTNIAIAIGLAAWLLRKILRRDWRLMRLPTTWVLAAWLASVLLSMVNTADVSTSLIGVRKFLKGVAVYWWIVETVARAAQVRTVILASVSALGVIVVDSLWQRLVGWDVFYHRPPVMTLETVQRVIATFHHPSDLAIYLVSVVPLLAALSGVVARRWRGLVLAGSAAAMLVMVLTFSRGGMLALIGALLVLGLLSRRRTPWAMVAVLGVLALAFTPAQVTQWTKTQTTVLGLLTEPERTMYWGTAMNMIRRHPLVGIGTNTFAMSYPRYRNPGDRFTEIGPYAHNQYLHLAAEQGLAGLAALLVFLGLVFGMSGQVRASFARHSTEAAIRDGLLAALVGYLIQGCLESSLFYARGSLTFWWLAALLSALWRLSRRSIASTNS